MNIHPGVMGIDISKAALDIFDAAVGRPERMANAIAEVEALAKRCAAGGVFVLFEATGSYDAMLRRALSTAGVPFARVNPARARDFARAAGFLAKTDAVDARMLAAMAQSLKPAAQAAVSAERERLSLLHKRRDQLVATRQQERARRSECTDLEIAADLDRHLDWLDASIKAIERRIAGLFAADADLRNLQALLRSAPGVGPVTARPWSRCCRSSACAHPRPSPPWLALRPSTATAGGSGAAGPSAAAESGFAMLSTWPRFRLRDRNPDSKPLIASFVTPASLPNSP